MKSVMEFQESVKITKDKEERYRRCFGAKNIAFNSVVRTLAS